jgi:Na+/H+-dicarboxylate symporter
MTLASIDVGALLKMFYASLIAGVGVAIVFSIAILGATRSSDMRRSGRSGPATAFAVLGVAGLLVAVGIVVYGVVLVAHKS